MIIFNTIKPKLRLLLTALTIFFSNSTFAGVGDVYFCEMTQFINIKDHEINNYYLEKFKFKRDSNQILFGDEDNYFVNYTMTISYSSGEMFDGYKMIDDSIFGQISYFEGDFVYSRSDYNEGTMVTAICSIF